MSNDPLIQHGEIHVDLDGAGALVVSFPDGTSSSANSADGARRIAERWLQRDVNRHGPSKNGMGKIVWHNGANFWKGARGSEQARVPGEARLTVGRAPAQEMPTVVRQPAYKDEWLGSWNVKRAMFVRIMHRAVFGGTLDKPALVLPEAISAIEVDSTFITLTRAADGCEFKWPLRAAPDDVAIEVCRIDVGEHPWAKS